jgi:hypothetical protein
MYAYGADPDVYRATRLHRSGASCVNRYIMPSTRVLSGLVFAIAVLLGGCYVDSGPPPPGYYGRPTPPSGYRSYEWHSYGRSEPRR